VRSKKVGLGSSFFVFLWLFQLTALTLESFAIDVTLKWDPSVDGVDGYFLCYRQESAGDPGNLGTYETIIKVPINEAHDPSNLADPSRPEFRIEGLDETKTYYFVVAAYDQKGYSTGSREVYVLGLNGIPERYRKDYDRGWGVSNGDLEGFTILYSSVEKGVPTFGPSQDMVVFSIADYKPVGPKLNFSVEPFQAPGFSFCIPVTLLIPVPDGYDGRRLSIGLYESGWTLVWDGESNSQTGGWDWLVTAPVHQVNNPFFPLGPSTIEIVVRHFSEIQLADIARGSVASEEGGGGGCFVMAVSNR
jgi:hypothetical protein